MIMHVHRGILWLLNERIGFLCVQLSFAISPGVSGKTLEHPLISLSTQFPAVSLHLPGYEQEKCLQLLPKAVNVCFPR